MGRAVPHVHVILTQCTDAGSQAHRATDVVATPASPRFRFRSRSPSPSNSRSRSQARYIADTDSLILCNLHLRPARGKQYLLIGIVLQLPADLCKRTCTSLASPGPQTAEKCRWKCGSGSIEELCTQLTRSNQRARRRFRGRLHKEDLVVKYSTQLQ